MLANWVPSGKDTKVFRRTWEKPRKEAGTLERRGSMTQNHKPQLVVEAVVVLACGAVEIRYSGK